MNNIDKTAADISASGTRGMMGISGRMPIRDLRKSELPAIPWQSHEGLKFKEDTGKSGWDMDRAQRNNIISAIEERGTVGEDDIDDYARQADMFGEESLTDYQQFMLHTGIDNIMAVEDFMYDIGRPYDFETGTFGEPLDKMYPRDRTTEPDTGRYLQIEYDGKPVNVYEHVPDETGMREFWGVDKDQPNVEYLTLPESDVNVLGVYEGQPFQAERDARAAFLNKVFEFEHMDLVAEGLAAPDAADHAEAAPDVPKEPDHPDAGAEGRKIGPQSVYAQMMAAKDATDERAAAESEKSGEVNGPKA